MKRAFPTLLMTALAGWAFAVAATAAEVRWRGGFGTNFAEKRNWELPSDLPAGLEPDQREAFRRVPGPNDHAMVLAEATVSVTTPVRVQQATLAGKLVVEGAQASFTAGNPEAEVVDAYGDLDVVGLATFRADNAAVVHGLVRAEGGGQLTFSQGTILGRATLVGSLLQGGKATRLSGGTEEDQAVVVRESLALGGEPGSEVQVTGFIQVVKEATWLNCRVTSGHVTIGDPESGIDQELRTARLRLLGGDERTVWITLEEGFLEFGREAELVPGPGRNVFSGAVRFGSGSHGIDTPPAGAEPVIFRGGTQTFQSRATVNGNFNPVLRFVGPIRFEDNARAQFDSLDGVMITWNRSMGAGGALQPVEVHDRAQVKVIGDLTVEGGVISGSAQVSASRLFVNDRKAPALLELRSGQLQTSAGILIRTNATLQVGDRVVRPEAQPTAELTGPIQVEDGGHLEMVGPINSVARPAAFDGQCLIHPGGVLTLQEGFGFIGSGAQVINFGSVTALPPPGLTGVGFIRGARIPTLLNTGTVTVEPNTILQVSEGDNFAAGRLLVKTGGALALVGQGTHETLIWSSPDGSPRTNHLGKLFNLRAGFLNPDTSVTFEDDARLEVIGEGRFTRGFATGPLQEIPGGLLIEDTLRVDHLVLGKLDGQTPQIRMAIASLPGTLPETFRDGLGLVIRKRLDWAGGAFIGTGGQGRPSLVTVELPATSTAFLQPPEGGFGDNCVLAGGLRMNVRGRLTINHRRALTCEDDQAAYLFHNGSAVTIQAARAQFGLTDLRVINRTTVTKLGEDPAFFNGFWTNEEDGRLDVQAGDWNTQRGVLSGGNFRSAVTGARFIVGGDTTLRDFTTVGGTLSVTSRTHFQGNCFVDVLQLGNGISSENQLFIESIERPDGNGNVVQSPSVLTVSKGMKWVSNGLEMTGGSQLVLGPDSQNHFESTLTFSPAGIFDAGRIENHGTTRLVGNNTSRFQADSGTTIENFGTFIFDTPEGGILFPGGFDGRISGLKFSNRGQVRITPPPLNNRQFELAFAFENAEGGRVQVDTPPQDPNAGGRRGGAPRPQADPPLVPDVVFKHRFTVLAGLCDLQRADVVFQQPVELRGGRLVLGGGGSGVFKDTINTQGGLLRLEEPGQGSFERLTTFRNRSGLFVGRNFELSMPNELNVTTGARLSGLGTIVGNIACSSGILAPGDDDAELGGRGALTVQGSVVFSPGATLEVDVPIGPDPLTDQLIVKAIGADGGNVSLAGTLQVNPIFSGDQLNPEFIPVLLYQNQFVGDFPTFQSPPFRNGQRFSPIHRDGLQQFGVVLVTDVSADLTLTSQAPLKVPTGASLSYTYTVGNRGPEEAPSPELVVTLPANATFVNSAPAGTLEAGKLTVNLPSLARDATTTVTVNLTSPATAASLPATATVASQRTDPVPENNTTQTVSAVLPDGRFTLASFVLNPAGRLRLTFETLPGVNYRIERSSDFRTWTPVQEFAGDGTVRVVDNLGSDAGPPEFFRLAIF